VDSIIFSLVVLTDAGKVKQFHLVAAKMFGCFREAKFRQELQQPVATTSVLHIFSHDKHSNWLEITMV